MSRLLPAIALLCLPAIALHATENTASVDTDLVKQSVSLRDVAMQNSKAWDILESLTKEVGPRMAGSPGDQEAVA